MSDVISRTKKVITPALGFDVNLAAEKAEGIYVWTDDGRKIMDFSCGIAVLNVGHRHPAVIAKMREQMDKYVHSGCSFFYEPLARAGELLSEVTPDGIEMFFPLNGGSETIDGAIKLARFTTRRQYIICFTGAFHGRTLGATSVTSSAVKYRHFYGPLIPSIYQAPFPHPYYMGDEDAAVKHSIQSIETMLNHIVPSDEVAAFLVEPQQGEGGYLPCPPAFMKYLREKADEIGALLVLDEVQTGMGRTAKWFAADHFGVKPDVMCIAKSVGDGMPISFIGGTREIMEAWPPGAHGTTFGGNPVACAAVDGVITAIREEKLLENGAARAEQAKRHWGELKQKYPIIGDVRGLGFMIGVEFVKDPKTKEPNGAAVSKLMAGCLEKDLVIVNCGPHGNVIRFIPPLVVTGEELEKAFDIITEVCATL
ncbi:MAG: aminotransferase class III-fold pyridoxal phosphate-dependent enzyme [Planctomycetota bacterium]|nr:MAG: aminotransferase class III-fold pyridoxal phosphate-dependent enzyme [Planctomycetota bacterium]